MKKDHCAKKEGCAFNHKITDDQRNNPDIREIMSKKRQQITKKKTDPDTEFVRRVCVFEFQKKRWMQMGSGMLVQSCNR